MPGKQYSKIAAVLVGDNSKTHTINLCERCFLLRQSIEGELKRVISEERSRGKLAVGMGKNEVETKTPDSSHEEEDVREELAEGCHA